jgi:hypothetical protein
MLGVVRRFLFCLPLAFACGGDDSKADAGPDATMTPDAAGDEPDVEIIDVAVDVPPERAIWVASPWTLYKFDPQTRVITRIADFDCSGEPMIDLAMNGKEELFGITSESVVRIDKVTAACTAIARGALDNPYATGFVAATSLEAGVEQWLGYKYTTYSSIDPDSGAITFVGGLFDDAGNSSQASGDMVSLAGGKTFLTAFNINPQAGDSILEVDPNTGGVTRFDGITGVAELTGIAQWAGALYVFSGKGRVYLVQITDAGVNLKTVAITYDLGDGGAASDAAADDSGDAEAGPVDAGPFFIPFRGAAVTTRAPTQ